MKAQILTTALAAATLLPSDTVQRFDGTCDGSAIAVAGKDHVVVASDEDNRLRVYRRGTAAPVRELDLNAFLRTEVNKHGVAKEADLEAVAALGSRLYWIGSHGRDKGADREPSRHRLFATALTVGPDGPTIEPAGTPYTALLDPMPSMPAAISDAFRKAEPLAPEKGGISIEGLTDDGKGGLLIGFRSPLVDGRAVVLPLRNPGPVVDNGARPQFGAPSLLALDGLGIRALERTAGADGVWVLAGPSDSTSRFRLFSWRQGGAARLRGELSATDGNPEGLAQDPATGGLLVSFDAGDIGAPPCKDQPPAGRSFPVRAWMPTPATSR